MNSFTQTSSLPFIWQNWRSVDVAHSNAIAITGRPFIQPQDFSFFPRSMKSLSAFMSLTPTRAWWKREVPRNTILVPYNAKQRSDPPTQVQRKLRSERRPWCLSPQVHGSRFPVRPSQAFHVIYSFIQTNTPKHLITFWNPHLSIDLDLLAPRRSANMCLLSCRKTHCHKVMDCVHEKRQLFYLTKKAIGGNRGQFGVCL